MNGLGLGLIEKRRREKNQSNASAWLEFSPLLSSPVPLDVNFLLVPVCPAPGSLLPWMLFQKYTCSRGNCSK